MRQASMLLFLWAAACLLALPTEASRLFANDAGPKQHAGTRFLSEIDDCQHYISLGYDCDCSSFVNGTGRFDCTMTCDGAGTSTTDPATGAIVCGESDNATAFSNSTTTASRYRWSTYCSTATASTSSSSTMPSSSVTYCINTESMTSVNEGQAPTTTDTCSVTINNQPCAACVMGSCSADASSSAAVVTMFDCTNVEHGLSGSRCNDDAVIDVANTTTTTTIDGRDDETFAPQQSPAGTSASAAPVDFPAPEQDDVGIPSGGAGGGGFVLDMCEFYDEHSLGCDCSSDQTSPSSPTTTSMNCVMKRSSCVNQDNSSSSPTTTVCFNQTLDFGSAQVGSFTVRECYHLNSNSATTTDYCTVKTVMVPAAQVESDANAATETCQILVNGVACNMCALGQCEGSSSGNNKADSVISFDCSNTEAATTGSTCNDDILFPQLVGLDLPSSISGGAIFANHPTASEPTEGRQQPTASPFMMTTFAPTSTEAMDSTSNSVRTAVPTVATSSPTRADTNMPTLASPAPFAVREPTIDITGRDEEKDDEEDEKKEEEEEQQQQQQQQSEDSPSSSAAALLFGSWSCIAMATTVLLSYVV